MNYGVTVTDHYSIPLGVVRVEIIAITFLISGLPTNTRGANREFAIIETKMSNPKHVSLMGRNKDAAAFFKPVVDIKGKNIHISPGRAGEALLWVVGF